MKQIVAYGLVLVVAGCSQQPAESRSPFAKRAKNRFFQEHAAGRPHTGWHSGTQYASMRQAR